MYHIGYLVNLLRLLKIPLDKVNFCGTMSTVVVLTVVLVSSWFFISFGLLGICTVVSSKYYPGSTTEASLTGISGRMTYRGGQIKALTR